MARKGDGIYLRGKTWYLDAMIEGKRHVMKLGKHINRTAASELASVKRAGILRQEAGIGRKKKDIQFQEAAKRFLEWCDAGKVEPWAGNVRPRTALSYEKCIEQLKKSFDGKPLSRIGSLDINRHKFSRKASPVRANRELQLLRRIFYWCMGQKPPLYEGINPLERNKDNPDSIKFYEESKGRERCLDPQESAELIDAANEPLRSMIVLALNVGLRLASEGFTLRWKAVDFRRGTITILDAYAKNGESRVINLNTQAREALLHLQKLAKDSAFVFCKSDGTPYVDNLYTSFRTACQKAGLTGVTPHTLRHTWASRLQEKHVDMRTIQELGGWKSVAMVQRYSHIADKRKAEAVKLLEEFPHMVHNIENSDVRGGSTRKGVSA